MKKMILGIMLLSLTVGIIGCGGGSDSGNSTATTGTILFINDTTYAAEIQESGVIVLDLDPGASEAIIVTPGEHLYTVYVSGTDVIINSYTVTATAGSTSTQTIQVLL